MTLNKIRINAKTVFFQQWLYLRAVEWWALRLQGDDFDCCSVWRRTIFSQLHNVGICLGPCGWWIFSVCQLVLKKCLFQKTVVPWHLGTGIIFGLQPPLPQMWIKLVSLIPKKRRKKRRKKKTLLGLEVYLFTRKNGKNPERKELKTQICAGEINYKEQVLKMFQRPETWMFFEWQHFEADC